MICINIISGHYCHHLWAEPQALIANYCSLSLFSFGQSLDKVQGKEVTQFDEVEWWRTLIVECVSVY